ncbi:MAG: nitroreductase [Eubacterium sp.]|nr:nitroreductase [Eubacterium sp.]
MNVMEVIRTRKSVRTFDGRQLTDEDRKALESYAKTITNPYGIPVNFLFLDAEEHSLSSPVINGEHLYVAGKVPKIPGFEVAFGYSFEKLVLYAWSRGIGTTWIGGTMDRELFEKETETKEDEFMPIVSPLGYPAEKKAAVDIKLRETVHGDERLDPKELFYVNDFSTPISMDDYDNALEVVRWSPSAVNIQPCRVIKDGSDFHFYKRHADSYQRKVPWDVQAIDIGIAICHFMSVTDGKFSIEDPGIKVDDKTEYIATVTKN